MALKDFWTVFRNVAIKSCAAPLILFLALSLPSIGAEQRSASTNLVVTVPTFASIRIDKPITRDSYSHPAFATVIRNDSNEAAMSIQVARRLVASTSEIVRQGEPVDGCTTGDRDSAHCPKTGYVLKPILLPIAWVPAEKGSGMVSNNGEDASLLITFTVSGI